MLMKLVITYMNYSNYVLLGFIDNGIHICTVALIMYFVY